MKLECGFSVGTVVVGVKFGSELDDKVGKEFGKKGVVREARVSLSKVESNRRGEPMGWAEGARLDVGH